MPSFLHLLHSPCFIMAGITQLGAATLLLLAVTCIFDVADTCTIDYDTDYNGKHPPPNTPPHAFLQLYCQVAELPVMLAYSLFTTQHATVHAHVYVHPLHMHDRRCMVCTEKFAN